MPVYLSWEDVALRLLLSVAAGAVIGFNRGEHGRPAGLRTTILVCLAASGSMILANLLLSTVGKAANSFVNFDVMRLPLGVLTGMGFLGGGAILRRGDVVKGITTAATMWFVTIMGLAIGSGQLGLGMALLALGMFVLVALKWVEVRMHEEHHATLIVKCQSSGPSEKEFRAALFDAGFQIISCGVTYSVAAEHRKLRCVVAWRARLIDTLPPPILGQLAQRPGVLKVDWKP